MEAPPRLKPFAHGLANPGRDAAKPQDFLNPPDVR